MAIPVLQSCQAYLRKIYRERLEYDFHSDLNALVTGRAPVWKTVSTTSMVAENASEEDPAGLVLDPEVGIILYLLPFKKGALLPPHVNQALRIRSQLSVERNYGNIARQEGDPFGQWRVTVCWLVAGEELRKDWLTQITEMRRETVFSEEISLDAVFFGSTDEHEKTLQAHGFPCLLLTTREILRKAEKNAVNRPRIHVGG